METLKTRDIPTLTNPHLPLSNNGYNPPLSAILKLYGPERFNLSESLTLIFTGACALVSYSDYHD
jgi:hypothetical protein